MEEGPVMERKWQPDVEMIAAQLIQDYREGDPDEGFLDALQTIAAWQDTAAEHDEEFTENDWVKLVLELVKRFVNAEDGQP
jgi:hypothetical protein